MVVPTGVGAKIGGYAGDASQYAQKIAKEFGLIVNPNVVNAACFSGITDDMLYVEGWGISELIKGNLYLTQPKKNKIGVIFDKKIPQNILNIHLNTINAMKCVYGFDISEIEITEEEVGIDYCFTEENISTGAVKNPLTLKKSALKLKEKNVDVIAIVCHFDDCEADDYENGDGVDIIGGIEGVISHYVSSETFIPCAHAPAFSNIEIEGKLINPKAASEYITPTFLPCLFFGLNKAPLYVKKKNKNVISYENISALIMPFNSLGSSIVLDALEKNIPVLAVKENETILNITSQKLNLDGIINLESYNDCIKYLKERK